VVGLRFTQTVYVTGFSAWDLVSGDLDGDTEIPARRKNPLDPGLCGVEVRGFEPLTSAVRRQRSTGLSYTPRRVEA
jgi:hypothetical protein